MKERWLAPGPRGLDTLDLEWSHSSEVILIDFWIHGAPRAEEESGEPWSKLLVVSNFSILSSEVADSRARCYFFMSVSPFAVCGQWRFLAAVLGG